VNLTTPAGWRTTRIDRVATVSARIGWKALTADEYVDDGYAFLATPNIKTREIDFAEVNRVTRFRFDESPDLKLQVGDVLLAKDGNTLGITNVVSHLPEPATVNGSIAVVRPYAVEPQFLRYWLASGYIQGQINALKDGMGVPHLFQRDINRLPVLCPPADEQRRIADFLDTETTRLDALLAARSTQRERYAERHVAAIDALIRGAAKADTLAEYKPLRYVPSSWVQTRLGNTDCDIQTGPFGSQLHAEDYVADGWPVVNPASISPEGLLPVPGMSVDDETRRRLTRHELEPGDIVFGRRGELGRAGLVRDENIGWLCGTGSLRLRLGPRGPLPEYLLRFLGIPAMRYYFLRQSVGSTMANLNTGILYAMPVLIPPGYEQTAIIDACQVAEGRFREIQRAVEHQATLVAERRQALITAAVTGQLDVTTARGGHS
jgi:type I restriction enzyme S subunit